MKNKKRIHYAERNEGRQRIFAKGAGISNNCYKTRLNNNDLIIGPAGAGKTTGYVLPNLLNCYGSYIVADTKGNLYNRYRGYLEDRGYDVRLINFTELKKSCRYNPLDFIEFHSPEDYCEQDVISLASTLCPVLSERDPFWENSCRTIVTAMIAYVLEALPEEERNMVSLMKLFKVIDKDEGKKLFLELENENPHSFAVKRYKDYYTLKDVDRTWGCTKQFLVNALWLFDFKEAEKIFGGHSDFDFADLGRRETVFFLNVSDTDRSMDRIVNIFYTQALQSLCRYADSLPESRLDIPVRIILDDFATNTNIPDFDKTISVIRSREISVSIILQSLPQLEAIYGRAKGLTVVNNCDHILYLGGQDIDTANYISFRVRKPPETVLELSCDKAYLLERGSAAKLVDIIRPEDNIIVTDRGHKAADEAACTKEDTDHSREPHR